MWPTSIGNRTLHGAEASLISAAIMVMLDALDEHLGDDDDDEASEPTADMHIGIAVFDSLTIPQRIAMLHHLSKHLLTDEPLPSEQTSAIDDATIAAVFSEIQDQVTIEIDLDPEDVTEGDRNETVSQASLARSVLWRSMILAAIHQVVFNDPIETDDMGLPTDASVDSIDAWEDAIDALASAILWDRDFELADGFMDEEPSSARQRRKLLGITDNYFVQPPLDPTVSQTRLMLSQARSIVSRRPR
jgi:hypothetical protein